MFNKFAQGMPPPPMPPMDPAMMAQMGGAMPPPPPMDPAMMAQMGGAMPPPPPSGAMPPPPMPPMDPAAMGMPMDPSMGGMPGGMPPGPPPPVEGMDAGLPPEINDAAAAELGSEDLRESVKALTSKVREQDKTLSNIERLLESVAGHIGIASKATGSRAGEEGDDAEKSAALSESDDLEQLSAIACGLRKYAANLLAEAEGVAVRE